MMKIVVVKAYGRVFQAEAYSADGNLACSSPKAIVAFNRRKKEAFDSRLSERQLGWIDQLNREPENQVDVMSIKSAIRFQV